jgi:hypothetical protein
VTAAADELLRLGVDPRGIAAGPFGGRQQPALLAVRGREERPDLLGDVRHQRVQQAQRAVEAEQQRRRDGGPVGLLVVQPRLRELEVPVAELGPEEVVEVERGRRQLEGVK